MLLIFRLFVRTFYGQRMRLINQLEVEGEEEVPVPPQSSRARLINSSRRAFGVAF